MRGELTTEQRLKQANSRLSNENAQLRMRVKELEERDKQKDQFVEDLLVRVSELEEMVFGKKKKETAGIEIHDVPNYAVDKDQTERDNVSYRRPLPSSKEITHRKKYTLSNCGECAKNLTQKKWSIRYVEDIHLGVLHLKEGWHRYIKTVLEQQIEKGFCTKCRTWHAAMQINTQEVTLGIEVRLFINYAVYILRLSYSQVKDVLWDLYLLNIASGEITNVLEFTACRLKGAYARLEKRILESKSLHADEAQWQTAKDKNYVWVAASGDSEECLFLTGKNRGKGNIEKLGSVKKFV